MSAVTWLQARFCADGIKVSRVFSKRKFLCFAVAFGLFLVYGLSYAADGDTGIASVFDQFRSATTTLSQKMVSYGANLLISLTLLQVAWNGADRFMKGNFEIKSVIGNMVRTSVVTTFFFIVIFKAPTWFLYAIDQWIGLGSVLAGGQAVTPGDLMQLGIDLNNSMQETLKQKAGSGIGAAVESFSIGLQVFFLRLLILFAFFVLSGQLALAMIKGYLWMCVGPLLLGFGGLKTTRDVAVNTLKAVVSHGVIIVTTFVIAGITFLLVPYWNQTISQFTLDDWGPFWNILFSAGLIALTAWQVPKYANDFINGSVSGGISEVSGAAITAAAGAAALGAGAMSAAGAAGGAMGGAASGLNGVMQAIGAGTSAAMDQGASGMGAVVQGVGHAATTGASMLGQSARDYGSSVLDKFNAQSGQSLGGQVANKIQSGRGGSISMPGASPDVGTGDASSAALSGGDGGGGGSGGGGGHSPSLAQKISGLQQHLPQGGDSTVQVSGMNGGGGSSDVD